MDLALRVLGELQVVRDGRQVEIGARLVRRLLVMLILEHRTGLSDDVLLEQLWPAAVPTTAQQSLRNSVARLRSLIGDDAVVRSPEGYRLTVTDERIDAVALDRRLAEARSLLAAGDAAAAVESAEAGLLLCRGAPLPEFAEEPWAAIHLAGLQEQVAAAEELWGEAALAAGRHPHVAEALTIRARRLPHREVRWEQALTALSGAGRRTDALRLFDEARATLLEEFGVEPGPALRELRQRIEVDDPSLWTPAAPSVIRPDTGRPHRVPLVGRADELLLLAELVRRHPIVTVSGPGGVGKSRVAAEVVPGMAEELGDVLVVELAPVTEPGALPDALAAALGVGGGERSDLEPLEPVVAALRRRRMLLVLDNAEQVLDGVRELVDAVLTRCPEVRFLVTTRAVLGHPAEVALALRPLAVPDVREEGIRTTPAAELLLAALGRTDDPPGPTEAAALGEVIRLVDGLPLAILTVARLLRSVPAELVVQELSDRRRLLALGDPEGEPRHRSLRTVVAWSEERLEPTDRRVFRRLGVFPASFTLVAAEHVADLGDLGRPVLATLADLVDASLLTVDHAHRPARYRMVEVHRQFAQERAQEAGEVEVVEDRLVAWYRDFVLDRTSMLRGAGQAEALAALRDEEPALRELLHRLPGTPRAEPALEMAAALRDFWFLTGRWIEGPRTVSRALAAVPDAPPALRARALVARAVAGGNAGALIRELPGLEEAARLALEVGDPELIASAHLPYGIALLWQRDLDGFRCFDVATSAVPEDPWIEALVVLYRGLALAAFGDVLTARMAARMAKRALRGIGDRAYRSWMAYQVGMLAERQGALDLATAELEESLELAEGLGLRPFEAHARWLLALVAVDQGRPDAEPLVAASRQELASLGDLGCVNACNRVLAGFERRAGRTDAALARLREQLDEVARRDDQELALSLTEIADIYAERGRAGDGAVLVAAAVHLATGSGIGMNDAQHRRMEEVAASVGVAVPAPGEPPATDAVLRVART